MYYQNARSRPKMQSTVVPNAWELAVLTQSMVGVDDDGTPATSANHVEYCSSSAALPDTVIAR